MYKGIVLDKVQTEAFLAIAKEEKLICEKGMTDGIFELRTRCVPSATLRKKIFEQFVIAGTIYVDPVTYGCMDGELVEKKIIMPYEKCKSDMTGFLVFDIDMVQRMMAEKGLDIKYYTTDRIRNIYNEWKEKLEEFLEFEREYALDYFEACLRKTIGLEAKGDNKEIDIKHFLELGGYIYNNPVINVLKEYKDLLHIAYDNDLLSPVINAVSCSNVHSEIVPPVLEGYKAVRILKYTSEKLDRIYTAFSLRDNVKLVQTDEAKAYRSKMDEWMRAFSEQKFDNMQIIEEDIVKAQKAMKSKKFNESFVGKCIATVGAIATPFSQVSTVGAIASLLATYSGLESAFFNPTKNYLWASFGIYHS